MQKEYIWHTYFQRKPQHKREPFRNLNDISDLIFYCKQQKQYHDIRRVKFWKSCYAYLGQ